MILHSLFEEHVRLPSGRGRRAADNEVASKTFFLYTDENRFYLSSFFVFFLFFYCQVLQRFDAAVALDEQSRDNTRINVTIIIVDFTVNVYKINVL